MQGQKYDYPPYQPNYNPVGQPGHPTSLSHRLMQSNFKK